MESLLIAVGVILVVLVVTILAALGPFMGLWFQSRLSNVPVSIAELLGMRFRCTDARVIVMSRIRAAAAGIEISTGQLESHFLTGGNVSSVVSALVEAKRLGEDLDWETACQVDLAGEDVVEVVKAIREEGGSACPLCGRSGRSPEAGAAYNELGAGPAIGS